MYIPKTMELSSGGGDGGRAISNLEKVGNLGAATCINGGQLANGKVMSGVSLADGKRCGSPLLENDFFGGKGAPKVSCPLHSLMSLSEWGNLGVENFGLGQSTDVLGAGFISSSLVPGANKMKGGIFSESTLKW